MAVITISRQYGSGGDEIAARLCEMLGYRYFDKELMSELSRELELEQGPVVDFCEDEYKVHTFMERFLSRPGSNRPRASEAQLRELDEEYAMSMVRCAIWGAYRQGNIVVLGRGGQVVLQHQHGVMHVRVEAPVEERIERVQYGQNISKTAATELVQQKDRAAADYLRHFYDIDWADPLMYHLVVNTGKIEPETAACLLAQAVTCLPLYIAEG